MDGDIADTDVQHKNTSNNIGWEVYFLSRLETVGGIRSRRTGIIRRSKDLVKSIRFHLQPANCFINILLSFLCQ